MSGLADPVSSVDAHIAAARYRANCIRWILAPFQHSNTSAGFAEIVGEAIDETSALTAGAGADCSRDMARLDTLRSIVDRAVAHGRGEDLDTVTARHLGPVWQRACDAVRRLESEPPMNAQTLGDTLSSFEISVSTHPYFELDACLVLIHSIRHALREHYGPSAAPHPLSEHQGLLSRSASSPIALLGAATVAILAWTVASSWNLYADPSFRSNLLSEAHGLVAELLVVGVIFALLRKRSQPAERERQEVADLSRALRALHYAGGGEAVREKSRLIRHLARLRPTASLNLRGIHLRGADLTGCGLHAARLDDACLEGANLTGADLEGASFVGAVMSGCDLSRANVEHADFERADLHDSHMVSTRNLLRSRIEYANLDGARLHVGLRESLPTRWRDRVVWYVNEETRLPGAV